MDFPVDCAPDSEDSPLAFLLFLVLILVMNEVSEGCYPIIARDTKKSKIISGGVKENVTHHQLLGS